MKRRTPALPAVPTFLALALAACAPKAPSGGSGTPAAAVTVPSAADRAAVAANMARAALIESGDHVLITGSVRDAELLEDLAVETMKLGGQPLIAMGSQRLGRRSYDEVPASFDTLTPTLDLALVNTFGVQLSVDIGESDSAFAGVSPERIAARSKAQVPVGTAFVRRGVRTVSLGNGLYPTAVLARRLGVPQSDLANVFWRAVAMAPESIQARGAGARAALAGGRRVTITAPNGTNFSFAVDGAKTALSDGALTAQGLRQGGAARYTWLPAGELQAPPVVGTAEGKIVIDKVVVRGTDVVGLTLLFSRGRLTSMTATSGLEPLQASYDAAGGAKDSFAGIDLGLNPEVKLPLNTGRIVWMAAGAVTIGFGDNQGTGGSNVSDFSMFGAIPGATVSVDGRAIIENGVLK
jgi:leucyl aminopeptidase (aminopeptidase T)